MYKEREQEERTEAKEKICLKHEGMSVNAFIFCFIGSEFMSWEVQLFLITPLLWHYAAGRHRIGSKEESPYEIAYNSTSLFVAGVADCLAWRASLPYCAATSM